MLKVLTLTALETFKVLRIVIPAVFLGLIASSYIYSIPVFKNVVKAIAKFTSKFGMKSGIAVAAFLIHPVTAYTLLSEMLRSGKINEKEVVIATLVGMFPRTLRLTILFLIPVAIPTLGVWGVYYVVLILFTRALVSAFGIVLAMNTFEDGDSFEFEIPEISLRDTLNRFFKVSATLSLTIFLVMLLFNLGLMNYFKSLTPFLLKLNLPPSSMVVVATGFPSMLAAIATAGSLLAKGVLTGKPLLISLFLASIAHSFVEVSRNTFPVSASILGKSVGFKVAVCILLSRILANLIAIFILIWF